MSAIAKKNTALLIPTRTETPPPESSPAPEPGFVPFAPPPAPPTPPPKSRKIIIAVVLIVVVAVGAAFGVLYTQTSLFRPRSASQLPGYNTYSNYGFSFQYLKTWTITEKGFQNNAPDTTSGIVIAQAPNGQEDLVFVAWTHFSSSVNASNAISSAINGFSNAGQGSGLTVGQETTSTTKAGYTVYLEPFSVTIQGTRIAGIWSAWYSTQGQRLYQLSAITSGSSASTMYNTGLSSFVEQ